jgi:hypothetical protein
VAQLTASQVYKLALDQGLSPEAAITATAIAYVESGFRTDAVGTNTDSHRSQDRGLWQINNYWNPDVSDQCAFDPVCNAATMARLSRKGTYWKPWSSFNNSRYKSAEQMVRDKVNSGATAITEPFDEGAISGSGGGSGGVSGILSNAASGIVWLVNPKNIARMLYGLFGIIAIAFGVMLLVKDAKKHA